MIPFISTFVLSFFAYLFLTASQGEVLKLWSHYEIFAGIIIALIVATFASQVLFQKNLTVF